MVSLRDITGFVDRIVERFGPRRVVLFGSYAYGEPTADSDVDLLVVMDHKGTSHAAATKVRVAAEASFPLDLLVRTPAELSRRIAMKDGFMAEILEKGVVLHAADDARVGQQGRRRLRRRLSAPAVA